MIGTIKLNTNHGVSFSQLAFRVTFLLIAYSSHVCYALANWQNSPALNLITKEIETIQILRNSEEHRTTLTIIKPGLLILKSREIFAMAFMLHLIWLSHSTLWALWVSSWVWKPVLHSKISNNYLQTLHLIKCLFGLQIPIDSGYDEVLCIC